MTIRKWKLIFFSIALFVGLPILIISNKQFNDNRALNLIGLVLIAPAAAFIFFHHLIFPFVFLDWGVKKSRAILNSDKCLLDSLLLLLNSVANEADKENGRFFVDEYALSASTNGIDRKKAALFLENLHQYGLLKAANTEDMSRLREKYRDKKNAHFYSADAVQIELIQQYYQNGLLGSKKN